LILLRRAGEGAILLEENRRRCIADGWLYNLDGSDGILGVCKVLQENIGDGIHWIEQLILRRDTDNRRVADWYRLILSEVYLQIIAGYEKLPFLILFKNLPILMTAIVTASSRIRALMMRVLENPSFDPQGHPLGHAQMILGLLYKTKKKHALAVQHLTEAQRIISQFGQTPMLARIDAALAELG